MKKTLLIGNFGARNIGDELILSFAVEENKNVVVMTADPRFSQEFCESEFETIQPFPSGIRSLFLWILRKRKLKIKNSLRVRADKNLSPSESRTKFEIDRVVFPGGGLFAIKTKADFIWWCQFQWAKHFFPKAEFILEYQGVDSKIYFLHKFFTKSVFSQVDEISVRDQKSAGFLSSLGIRNVKVVGDRVEEQLQITNYELRSDRKYILINAKKSVSGLRWKQIQKEILENKEMVFVCFDPEDAMFVPRGFKGEIFYPHTKKETYELFKNASMAIGQRLHFLILAEHFCGNKNTFVLGKPYAEKVGNFCEKRGVGRK